MILESVYSEIGRREASIESVILVYARWIETFDMENSKIKQLMSMHTKSRISGYHRFEQESYKCKKKVRPKT